MTTTLRCALIGTGSVANLHAQAVAAHARAELIAVTDQSRSAADAFADRYDVPAVYDDLEELLVAERPDVVLICTPPGAHRAQTIQAFAAGAHVVVEKPPGAGSPSSSSSGPEPPRPTCDGCSTPERSGGR